MSEMMCAADKGMEAERVEGLRAALEGRAAFYETLAALYFKPLKQEQIDAMAEADLSAYADVNELFADGLNDIVRTLRKRNTDTRKELAVDFTAAFIGTSSWKGRYAVPYKSVFTSDEGLMYQEGFQEVFAAYKSHCVKRREGLDLPDDHLSFMCEFMAILSRRAIAHVEDGELGLARRDLEFSREFLREHIVSWFDDFADLAGKIIKTRFYRGVLKISKGFFELDRDVLDDMIEEVSQQ